MFKKLTVISSITYYFSSESCLTCFFAFLYTCTKQYYLSARYQAKIAERISITAFGGTSVVPDGHIEGIAKNSI